MEKDHQEDRTNIINWLISQYARGVFPTASEISHRFDISFSLASRLARVAQAKGGQVRSHKRFNMEQRREDIYNFIRQYHSTYGWAPSQREIAEAVGASLNAVNIDLEALEHMNRISMGPMPRQIRLTNHPMKEPEVTL